MKFVKIQDGGGRHLEFRKSLIVSANTKQFSPNFNRVYLTPTNIDPYGQKCKFSKIQDGGRRHLEFRKSLIVSANMKQLSPNFNSIYLALTTIDP
jgi:tRNA1(Val) A37 N6-methylase TrmN6